MKPIAFTLILLCLFTSACNRTPAGEKTFDDMTRQPAEDPGLLVERYKDFKKITPENISNDLFMINNRWMLVSAGRDSNFNTMTASWGGFGTAWSKPVAFMLIKNTRYTFEFLQKDSVYTLSFFDKKYRDTLQMLGSKSGRDFDKIKKSGFTPLRMPSGAMSFKEADLVIECKKLLSQPIDTSNITSSDVMNWYREEPGVHNIFFGEIIGVWKK
ncbi:MAG: flavin reductase [Candidatus Azobacteroides sp.]|nr:flavin reductase [Candidatus Azobacteroides sp.]